MMGCSAWLNVTQQLRFLMQGTPKDIFQLHTAIDRRVIALQRNTSEGEASACPEETSDNDINDSCEGATCSSNETKEHRGKRRIPFLMDI